MSKSRTQIVGLLIVLGVGGVLALVAGLWIFVSATAPKFHPNPDEVPSASLAASPAKWADAIRQARQIARAEIADQNLPGLSVAVGAGGELVWAEGFGWADVEDQVPVQPDTRFRVGTTSMMLTSAGVGLLLEQNRMALDDEIQKYVPGFPKKAWPVTVRQVMGHLAGIRPDEGDEEPVRERCERTDSALERFADRPLLSEPGTRYRFTTYGWILMSVAVETAAGERFLTFMRREVFEPLGMNDTRADAPTEPQTDQSTYYFPRFAADPRYGPQGREVVDMSCFAGAEAFLTTPSDLVRFGLAMSSGKLLQPATVALLQTSQRLASGEETGYGLGWDLETVEIAGQRTRVVGHDGDMRGGLVSSVMIVRDAGLVVAVLSNTSFADTPSIAVKIATAFAKTSGSVLRFP